MYTRVTWSHVKEDTFVYPRDVYSKIHRPSIKLAEEEYALLNFIFSLIDVGDLGTLADSLAFLDKDALFEHIGMFLLNFVFHHTIFINPGIGIHHQVQGWPMGRDALEGEPPPPQKKGKNHCGC